VVEAALGRQSRTREARGQQSKAIRVDADRLSTLINLVGELVIASANTQLLAQRLGDSGLLDSVSVFSHLVEEIRDNALALRMVQIGETFNRFQRVVHDVSREMGKEIDLVVSGADTELDKALVERIGDPLMHLVRNAIDHGIEAPEAREAAGKPRRGTLRLNAYHDSGSIVIEVADDGRGIDRDRLLEKARDAGVVQPQQHLTDAEVLRLVFEAGLSTAGQVTDLSGRGVGMDVVKRGIEALRGSVDVDSEPGRGTRMTIRLPLTLAIIDGFLVGVGDSSYVIPLDTVVECLELSADEQKEIERHQYVNLRGEVLPLLCMRSLFGEQSQRAGRQNVVVVHYAGQKAGLLVDTLHGEFQTVIKPMGAMFERLAGISGATILGSGEVALILDVQSLTQRAEGPPADAREAVALGTQ
jgi:two-component system chemotaxis sensor kinase CheA